VTIEIEVDGVRRQVTLRRDGNQWLAAVDGRELSVSVVEAGGRWSMLVGPAEALPAEAGSHKSDRVASAVRRKSYDIAIEPAVDGELIVHVNGVALPLTVIDRRHRRRRGGQSAGDESRPREVVAPMPGRIVKVLVKPGEGVERRQGLVVVEAMKMENELRAPRAGTVAEVRVTEGASVEANAVLVVLK
jgi:biotin carboxyl carrier protein